MEEGSDRQHPSITVKSSDIRLVRSFADGGPDGRTDGRCAAFKGPPRATKGPRRGIASVLMCVLTRPKKSSPVDARCARLYKWFRGIINSLLCPLLQLLMLLLFGLMPSRLVVLKRLAFYSGYIHSSGEFFPLCLCLL